MVARISSGVNPTGVVYYNENKVEKNEADRLSVRNFDSVNLPLEQLTVGLIAGQLEDRADLNTRVSKPTFHASLSLAQGETPSRDELIAIADRYMDGMGYGSQPYAIYQHHDTEHPHIHIVSVRVDEFGKKVSDTYERERSNKLRQQIEKEFGLQIAERADLKPPRQELTPLDYAKGDIKRQLSTVVNGVLKDFTFSSFAQFNQCLGFYNIRATEVAVTGKKPGLVYGVIDATKTAVGVPYKASSLPQQPTMETVNRRVNAGKKIKGDKVAGVRKAVGNELALSTGWDDFQQRLSRKGLETIPYFTRQGSLFGLSFVDVRNRTIYTGSELGKAFTAGTLRTTLGDAYQPPSQRVALDPPARPEGPATQLKQTQPVHRPERALTDEPSLTQPPMHNADLIRQLLYALSEDAGPGENEQELKTMLKRSRLKSR